MVTGGTGFLGAYIIRDLVLRGYRVRALRRSHSLPSYIEPSILERVEWIEGDIHDVVALEDSMRGAWAVIHSAAVVSFRKKDRKRMYQVNVEGTANVVNIALEQGVKRFIHISSVAALGRSMEGGHVDEEKKWEETKVNTHYARSKMKAELQVWRGFSEGLEGVILNPSTILGYGNWNNGSCTIFRNVHRGFDWYTDGINGFVDVEDVSRVTVAMLDSQITGERFIVNGENWAFKKLQDEIARAFNRPGPRRAAGPGILGLGWRLEKIRSFFSHRTPLLTRESVRVAVSRTHFDNNKLLSALPGFQFTPLERSIAQACLRYSAKAGTEGNHS